MFRILLVCGAAVTMMSAFYWAKAKGFRVVTTALRWLGWFAAWAWTIVAGGGGLGLLITQGPWPPTNGWFALFSGISACPLTAWVLKNRTGWTPSGYVRLGAAFLIILAGRTALAIEGRPFLPHS